MLERARSRTETSMASPDFMLGFADRGVSLEFLLGGQKLRTRLVVQCSEDLLRRNVRRGKENRIPGSGLVKGLLDS